MKIKYYVREYTGGKYFLSKIKPYIPNNKSPTIGDMFYDRWADYTVTNVKILDDKITVYMDKKNCHCHENIHGMNVRKIMNKRRLKNMGLGCKQTGKIRGIMDKVSKQVETIKKETKKEKSKNNKENK